MPAKHKKAVKGKKKGYKRKTMPLTKYMRELNRNPSAYMGMNTGIPLNRSTTLRYCEQISLTSSVGILAHYKYRANGCHDPNFTGTGHQPFGWDQYKLLYNHYIVSGSRIRVQMINATNNSGHTAGIYLDDDTTNPSFGDPSGYIESGRGTYYNMSLRESATPVLKSTFDCKRFFNIVDVKDNVMRLGNAVNADPTELAVYNIWYAAQNGDTGTVLLTVVIEFDIHFSEPVDLGQS